MRIALDRPRPPSDLSSAICTYWAQTRASRRPTTNPASHRQRHDKHQRNTVLQARIPAEGDKEPLYANCRRRRRKPPLNGKALAQAERIQRAKTNNLPPRVTSERFDRANWLRQTRPSGQRLNINGDLVLATVASKLMRRANDHPHDGEEPA